MTRQARQVPDRQGTARRVAAWRVPVARLVLGLASLTVFVHVIAMSR